MLSPKNSRKGISLGEIGKVTKGKAFIVIGLKGKKIIQEKRILGTPYLIIDIAVRTRGVGVQTISF